jgi:hypothetical protein
VSALEVNEVSGNTGTWPNGMTFPKAGSIAEVHACMRAWLKHISMHHEETGCSRLRRQKPQQRR